MFCRRSSPRVSSIIDYILISSTIILFMALWIEHCYIQYKDCTKKDVVADAKRFIPDYYYFDYFLKNKVPGKGLGPRLR